MNTQKDFLIQQIKGLLTDKETSIHNLRLFFSVVSHYWIIEKVQVLFYDKNLLKLLSDTF
jgi:hypothetical protein